jgi:hypothetical protein
MMNQLQYEILKRTTETVKPYRGTPNRFPLSYRAHAHKCFFVKKDEQGNDEYHIAYGYKYLRKDITKEEYDTVKKIEAENQIARRQRKPLKRVPYVYEDYDVNTPEKKSYWKSCKDWDIIGVVRSDNTFEFTTDRYLGQGTRHFLTQLFGSYKQGFSSQVRKGGVVFEEWEGNWRQDNIKKTKTIPIFQGLRMNLADNTSATNYTVHAPKVNRKRSDHVLGGRKLEFKFMDAFFKTMSGATFMDELQETFKGVFPDEVQRWRSEDEIKAMYDYALKHKDTDPVKSMYAIMMGRGIHNAWYLGRNGQQWGGSPNPYHYFNTAKKHMLNQLIREGGVLDYKEYGVNEVYPSNSWGIKVTVDGKEVKVY